MDDPDNVREIGRVAAARGLRIGMVVEVDVGMGRAGVAPGEAAVELSRLIASTAGLSCSPKFSTSSASMASSRMFSASGSCAPALRPTASAVGRSTSWAEALR